MEALENNFSEFEIPGELESSVHGDILVIKKWSWEYEKFLEFQRRAQEFILKNKKLKIYIFCNHPHCFTLGRGNERGNDELVEFSPSVKLEYKIHKIHRGGGITYHYPGQWIFYPIISINVNYSLDDHMCWLLKSTAEVLKNEYGLKDVLTAKKLMGIWINKMKLASIGVGVNRFVTEHGLALNLVYDEVMFSEVLKINPCGLNSEIYTTVNKIILTQEKNLVESFHKNYLSHLNLD